MTVCTPSIFFQVSSAVSASYNANAPVVSLPYAHYQGFHNSTSGLDVFLGIRYAQAPVGDLRWRAPKAPVPVSGILQATSQPAICPQPVILPNGTSGPDLTGDEDCLFLNVYTPPLSTAKKSLPVLVWIHGGAYFFGDAASYDPTPMIQASECSFVAVVIQYRFLPGSEVKKNGALNAGLLDVQFALKWTQQNIHLFGGDPDQVTIWGESAGAGAVLTQLVSSGSKTSPALFKRAISSSLYLPPSYRYDDPESELSYAAFVKSTGCSNALDTLQCLRGLNQTNLMTGNNQRPRPVIDGTLLSQRPQLSLAQKLVYRGRLLSLHNADEGRLLFAQNASSTVKSWIIERFPRLSQQNITAIEDSYRRFASDDASEMDNVYKIQTMIHGEAIMACPSVWLADAASESSYMGLFAVPPAHHGLDFAVYFPSMRSAVAPPAVPISESLVQSFVGALVSFILVGSPNENPMNQSINPEWGTYDPINPKGMVFNVTTSGTADSKYKMVDSGLRQRCSLWAALATFTQQ